MMIVTWGWFPGDVGQYTPAHSRSNARPEWIVAVMPSEARQVHHRIHRGGCPGGIGDRPAINLTVRAPRRTQLSRSASASGPHRRVDQTPGQKYATGPRPHPAPRRFQDAGIGRHTALKYNTHVNTRLVRIREQTRPGPVGLFRRNLPACRIRNRRQTDSFWASCREWFAFACVPAPQLGHGHE